MPRVDVLEADLIVLMSALCRLAARRRAGTDADLYVKAGKKLASDILMKVLSPSTHFPDCCYALRGIQDMPGCNSEKVHDTSSFL